MALVKKIHFINRIDRENAGDWSCSPLNYYYGYFKQFNIIRHDIDFVDYNEIEKEDIVIIGGSGMLDVTYSFNTAINNILDRCDNVIAWSVGFNTHNEQWYQGKDFPEIKFDRFTLIGIRDFNHPSGIEYLPCPSAQAFSGLNNQETKFKRKYGVIEHKDLPIRNSFFEDKITNAESLSKIAEYIYTSEAIITNSYHCAYWTLLLKRKAIVVNKFSTKFDYFKYQPEFVVINEQDDEETVKQIIEQAFEDAQIYDNFYDEAIELNDLFFDRVKRVIESKEIPAEKDYQALYQLNVEQLWNRQVEASKINLKIFEFHEDAYGQINKLYKEIELLNERVDELKNELENRNKPIMKKIYYVFKKIINR